MYKSKYIKRVVCKESKYIYIKNQAKKKYIKTTNI